MLTDARLRDAWLLVVIALLPAAALAALGLRALRNEEAAVRREAALVVEATSTRVTKGIERALDEGAVRLSRANLAGDDATLLRAVASLAPPFAEPVVLDASGSPRALASDHEDPVGCDDLRSDLADGSKRATARQKILDRCEHARTPSERFLWPIVALEADASVPAPRIEAWVNAHRTKLRGAERAAIREALERLGLLAIAAALDANGGASDVLAAALEDPSLRRAAREGGALRTESLVARLRRLDDGRIVGFVAHASVLAPFLARANDLPSGVRVRLARPGDAGAQEAPSAYAAITPALGVLAHHADPRALERAASQSRTLLAALAASAALAAFAGAFVVLSRLRAERRNAALRTDFVSTVSHELRTPLASLRMLAELLEENRVVDDERAEVHAALAREARRMGDTIDRLLGFGRMAAGRYVVSRARVPLHEVVARAIAEFEERFPDKEVERDLGEIDADVDEAQLRLALDNLLVNAAKYAPEGAPYRVRLAANDREVVLEVSDRGPGIPRRDRRRIFRPFERGDARLSRATEGSGIGLSLVAHVAKAHDGRVELASDAGKGATFTLRIRRYAT